MSTWSRGQWALRLIVLGGVAVALVALGRPGHPLPAGLLLIGLALALVFALRPESSAGLLALGYVLVVAAIRERHRVDVSALAVVVGLLAAHVAATLASYTPARATPDRATVLLWARRAVLVLVPAVVAWAAVAVVGDAGRVVWVLGAALVVAAAVAVTALLQERT